MKRFVSMILCCTLILSAGLSFTGCASKKSEYPSKPIELIIPWTAGGGTDVATRLFATYLEKQLGTTINVTNIPGGTGSVGSAQVAAANPDGYTLLQTTFDFVTADVQQLAGFTIDDFDAIGSFSVQPTVYCVLSKNWDNVDDYIAYAKANPGKVTVSHNGEGGVWHQAASKADAAMGIENIYVPYDGSSEQLAALLGGHTDAASISYNTVADYVKSGEIFCLGIMTDERIAALPDTPTFKEQGYDVVYSSFRGIVAPAGLPDDIRTKLVSALEAAANDPEWQDAAEKGSIDTWNLNGEDYKAFLDETKVSVTKTLTDLGLI